MLFVMDSRAGEARSVPWWLFPGHSLSVLTTIFPRPTKESSQVLISFWSSSWLRHCQTVTKTTHGNTQNHNPPYPMRVSKLRNVWGHDFALCFDWVRVREVNLLKIYEKRQKTRMQAFFVFLHLLMASLYPVLIWFMTPIRYPVDYIWKDVEDTFTCLPRLVYTRGKFEMCFDLFDGCLVPGLLASLWWVDGILLWLQLLCKAPRHLLLGPDKLCPLFWFSLMFYVFIYLSIYVSIYLFISQSSYLSINRSTYLFIYLY